MNEDDHTLLRRFADQNDSDAFRVIVDRHLPLVHSAALRQVCDADLAQDVCQSVFIVLARKAAKLKPQTVLSGWLYRTARFTALRALKSEQRRIAREQATAAMNNADSDQQAWSQLEPDLDEAMSRLSEKDRDAILLRYFENRNLSEVGAQLGVSEDAAQKRVSRAVEKLRRFFTRRSIPISATAISTALANKAVAAVPAEAAKAICAKALLQSAAASTITLPLAQATLEAMTWTKLKTAVVASAVVVVAGTPAVLQQETIKDLREENIALAARAEELAQSQIDDAELGRLRSELEKYKTLASEVHELRARLAKLQREGDSDEQLLAALDQENNKLKQTLAAVPEREARLSYEEAKALEKASFERRMNDMKSLGLAYHIWKDKNPDRLPQSVAELAAALGIKDKGQLNDLVGRLKLFPHSPDTKPQDGYHPVIVAERLPTNTVDGKQLWLYTMLDGSVLTSGAPLTEDGFLPPNTRN